MKKGTAALFALLLEFYSCSKKINNEPTKKEVDESYYNVAECMKIDDALRFRSELSLNYISNHSHNDELEYDLNHALIHYLLERTTGNPQDDHKYPFSFECEFIK